MPRTGSIQTFQSVLRRLVRDLGLDKAIRQRRSFELWPSVVGDQVANVTAPLKFENGRLFVQVRNSVWRAELAQQREMIRTRLNEALDSDDVREIILI